MQSLIHLVTYVTMFSCNGLFNFNASWTKVLPIWFFFIDHSYMCENFKYMFKCCGKISQWKFYAAKTGTLQLQVWRRTADQVYEMIGENYCQITSNCWSMLIVSCCCCCIFTEIYLILQFFHLQFWLSHSLFGSDSMNKPWNMIKAFTIN